MENEHHIRGNQQRKEKRGRGRGIGHIEKNMAMTCR